jgi:hypothetical protein
MMDFDVIDDGWQEEELDKMNDVRKVHHCIGIPIHLYSYWST